MVDNIQSENCKWIKNRADWMTSVSRVWPVVESSWLATDKSGSVWFTIDEMQAMKPWNYEIMKNATNQLNPFIVTMINLWFACCVINWSLQFEQWSGIERSEMKSFHRFLSEIIPLRCLQVNRY